MAENQNDFKIEPLYISPLTGKAITESEFRSVLEFERINRSFSMPQTVPTSSPIEVINSPQYQPNMTYQELPEANQVILGHLGAKVVSPDEANAPTFKQKIFDGPNLLNASITTLFGTLASFADVWSSRKLYDLYKEQEQLYIDSANLQANRLKRKGDIALANLISKHASTEGQNELAVAGAGAGAISGSFVDKLMANRKYDTREEFAQELETQYAVSSAKQEGYINAYKVANAAYSKAIGQRNNALEALFKGLERGVSSILGDMQAEDSTQSSLSQKYKEMQYNYKEKKQYYQNKKTDRTTTKRITPYASTGASIVNLENGKTFDSTEDPTKLETINSSKKTYSILKVPD